MDEPRWISRSVLTGVHPRLIRAHGGSHGVRDENLIQSALARPRQRWTYDPECDLADLAASYGFGLAKNHGFVDGNKRIALAALGIFLASNGQMLEAPEPEVIRAMEGIASGEMGETELAAWIRSHLVPFTE
jgi:death on curing protein